MTAGRPGGWILQGGYNLDKHVSVGKESPFEQIKQTNEQDIEFWFARDLLKILEYSNFRNFENAIEKAKISCEKSGQEVSSHFAEVRIKAKLGLDKEVELEDYALTRYACYLIIQNADSSKPMVALGQAYFAIQTRKQELFEISTDNEKRLMLREEIKQHNKYLASAAYDAGVESSLEFAIFQNHGYKGLYGGLDCKDIHRVKGLKKSQQILDHMGSTELAANLFRATQTEEKIRRENIKGKQKANDTHFEVGAKVRKTIQEIGGTMPEKLPVANSIKKLEKEIEKEKKQIEEINKKLLGNK